MKNSLQELIQKRDELCFKMIECDANDFGALCAELNEVEMNLEAVKEQSKEDTDVVNSI